VNTWQCFPQKSTFCCVFTIDNLIVYCEYFRACKCSCRFGCDCEGWRSIYRSVPWSSESGKGGFGAVSGFRPRIARPRWTRGDPFKVSAFRRPAGIILPLQDRPSPARCCSAMPQVQALTGFKSWPVLCASPSSAATFRSSGGGGGPHWSRQFPDASRVLSLVRPAGRLGSWVRRGPIQATDWIYRSTGIRWRWPCPARSVAIRDAEYSGWFLRFRVERGEPIAWWILPLCVHAELSTAPEAPESNVSGTRGCRHALPPDSEKFRRLCLFGEIPGSAISTCVESALTPMLVDSEHWCKPQK
jgi:hypothetical protein